MATNTMNRSLGREGRRAKAEQVREEFRAREEGIRNDPRLTPETKQRDINTLKTATNTILAELAEFDREDAETERKKLERDLFSPPGLGLMSPGERVARDASFRDAMQRARATSRDTQDDLVALLNEAELTSDALQARAAMAVALERRNVPALNAWIDGNPHDDGPINRLFELTDNQRNIRELTATAFAFQSV